MERKNLVMFRSITSAMKAQEYLAKQGIRSEIIKTPKRKTDSGCGFSLFIPRSFSRSVTMLKNTGIPIIGIISEGESI